MKVTIKGETQEYRQLRDQLLEAEIALKDQTERVASFRRQLPLGPQVETDYVFREGPPDLNDNSPAKFRDVRFSELFAPGKDSLIVDHLMWADGYSSIAPHVSDKVNFVLVAKVELARLRDWGRRRGWEKMRLLSSHDNTFNRDYLVEDEKGQRPAVSVFRRAPDGKIYFTYTTEMSRTPGHHRGIDPFSAVWHFFDLLPEGRENWMPRHFYGPESRSATVSLSAPGPAPDARK